MKELTIEVFFEKGAGEKSFELDKKKLQQVLFLEKIDNIPQKINIIFVDNPKIQRLNAKFRGVDEATDVLSFNYNDGKEIFEKEEDKDSIGEVYISVPFLERSSKESKVPLGLLVRQMVIHGMLHLAGYNHKKKKEEDIMKGLENKMLTKWNELEEQGRDERKEQ